MENSLMEVNSTLLLVPVEAVGRISQWRQMDKIYSEKSGRQWCKSGQTSSYASCCTEISEWPWASYFLSLYLTFSYFLNDWTIQTPPLILTLLNVKHLTFPIVNIHIHEKQKQKPAVVEFDLSVSRQTFRKYFRYFGDMPFSQLPERRDAWCCL